MRFFKKLSISVVASVIAFGLVALSFSPYATTNAQTAPADVSAREAALQAQLNDVLNQIAQQQTILNGEQTKAASFARDIAILNAQIKQAQLTIQAHEIAIQALGKDITQKTDDINVLTGKIQKNQNSLGQLMRETALADSESLVEIVLNGQNLSDFFTELNIFDSLKQAVKNSSDDIRSNKTAAEIEKDSLNKQQIKEVDAKISVQDEQAKIKAAEAQKQQLLNLSVKQQKDYQAVINSQQKQAAQIRAALFALRDTSSISFGQALQYANAAAAKTGIRAAFLLAILTQESNLGKNTGSCYLKDATTGAGVGANTGTPMAKVMHPTRDVPIFVSLLGQLGRDPYGTKVSCPQSIGWGGAMGPAQFIPSTWQLLQSQIGSLTGKSLPDPWDPQDAFMASALYLSNLGANAGSPSSELNAACKYYSGKACSAGTGASYGNSVIAKAANIQTTMIDPLQGV